MPEEGGKKKAEEAAVAPEAKRPRQEGMPNITPNVEFDTLAREWRCKWSPDDDKASLAACQDALTAIIAEVKAIKGVKGVQRVVCGGCNDFKVIVSIDPAGHDEWSAAKYEPEASFLATLTAIKGVTQVETQTYTIMPC